MAAGTMPTLEASIQDEAFRVLQSRHALDRIANQRPNYWMHSPALLCSTASVHNIAFGTGHQIYRQAILPAIEQAEHEVMLVTCFWARSATLDALNGSLGKLSAKAVESGRDRRVRICFSSSSVWQKLFQSPCLAGQIWRPDTWTKTLGLPSRSELPGLDVEIKSVFQLPFSVMHPKFVIIDRKFVLLPSCNISWEDWFEGCVSLSGDVVQQFVGFWKEVWASDGEAPMAPPDSDSPPQLDDTVAPDCLLASLQLSGAEDIPTVFLPHPHHRFAVPWLTSENPPPTTPLNIYLLTLFRRAEHRISIQTPNLTAQVVLSELLAALERGIDVTILTSDKLMRLEQIVTAGTTTARCVRNLIRRHEALRNGTPADDSEDVEAGLVPKRVGNLVVKYFSPRAGAEPHAAEPVQSHFKFTAVDGRIAVLGSGNLDRASWFTSQELGLALTSEKVVKQIEDCLAVAMEGRSRVVYDSGASYT